MLCRTRVRLAGLCLPLALALSTVLTTALIAPGSATAGSATGRATTTGPAATGPRSAPPATPRSGPRLDVSTRALSRSLACSRNLTTQATTEPVLLVPGTTLTAATNFDWNYENALVDFGIPYCAVTIPDHGMGDIQVAAEYVVHAIRQLHRVTGQRVHVVGFSQGGMSPRWALKYWPDTRGMVSDVIGIDPSNHGTISAVGVCLPGCAPAFRQQQTGSRFLAALNRGPETWPGIDYTTVYTVTDEVVAPNLGPRASSALHTGRGRIANLSIQSICGAAVADHLTMGSTDPVAWAVVYDALRHDGPARPARINRGACLSGVMPGVNLAELPRDEVGYLGEVATQVLTHPRTMTEPPLKPYAR